MTDTHAERRHAWQRPHGDPQYRSLPLKDWTVANPNATTIGDQGFDTFEEAITHALTLFEDIETTTVHLQDNIGRVRYTLTASDF